jgi:toxin ParE1/3/4
MDHIAQNNQVAALELDELIEQKAEQIPAHPELYRTGRKRGSRKMVVHPNYILIYRLKKEVVEILRVKHAAHQWP